MGEAMTFSAAHKAALARVDRAKHDPDISLAKAREKLRAVVAAELQKAPKSKW